MTLPAKCDGSLVLRGADALDASAQHQLLEWLTNTKPSPQIITTCSTPLFALVQRGTFAAALYYRLNAVTLILTPKETAAVAGREESETLPVASRMPLGDPFSVIIDSPSGAPAV